MQVEEAERLGVTRGGELLACGDQVVPGLERRRVGVESGVCEVRDVDRERRAVELARQAVERAVLALSSREGAPDVASLDVGDRRLTERLGVDRGEQPLRDVVAAQGQSSMLMMSGPEPLLSEVSILVPNSLLGIVW